MKYKVSTAIGVRDRVLRLSDPQFHNTNLEKVEKILIKNNYPKPVVRRIIRKDYRRNESDDQKNSAQNEQPKVYRSLTFVNGLSHRLDKMFRNEIPEVCVAHKVRKKVGDLYTKLKDKIPALRRTGVVYNIPCESCESTYIGETGRLLQVRTNEHAKDLEKPRQRDVLNTKSTALAAHYHHTGHKFNVQDVTILTEEYSNNKRKIKEALHILGEPKACNYKTDCDNIGKTYSNVLVKHQNKRKQNRRPFASNS